MISQAQYDEKGELKWIDTVLEDITERKKLEEQLRRSQKLEAIGTLAEGVAHDFNNILTAIIGYSNLLKLQIEENGSLADNVNEILSAAQRAAHLTHSLLAFSRKQVISLKPVDINEIIRHINKLLVRIIGEDIELQTYLSSQELVILADGGQMEQILVNPATNARDARPEGGRITIRSERMVKTDSHDDLKPGSYAVVSLSDTGKGMDEATRQRIFESFSNPCRIFESTRKPTFYRFVLPGAIRIVRGWDGDVPEADNTEVAKKHLPRRGSVMQPGVGAQRLPRVSRRQKRSTLKGLR